MNKIVDDAGSDPIKMAFISYPEHPMKAVPFHKARRKLAPIMDSVCSAPKPIAITQPGGRNAVLVSLDEFEAFQETAYLL